MPKNKKQPPRNKPPAFQFYVKDWTASPTRQMMSLAGQGAYINLLAVAWDSDPIGTVPNQPDKLWKLAGATPDEWTEITHEVLQNFEEFDEDPKRLVNKRLRRQWVELKEFSDMASKRAHRGAEARWGTAEEQPEQIQEEIEEEADGDVEDPEIDEDAI